MKISKIIETNNEVTYKLKLSEILSNWKKYSGSFNIDAL